MLLPALVRLLNIDNSQGEQAFCLRELLANHLSFFSASGSARHSFTHDLPSRSCSKALQQLSSSFVRKRNGRQPFSWISATKLIHHCLDPLRKGSLESGPWHKRLGEILGHVAPRSLFKPSIQKRSRSCSRFCHCSRRPKGTSAKKC